MHPARVLPERQAFPLAVRARRPRTPTAYTYYGYLAATLILKAISDIGTWTAAPVMFNLVTNGPSTDLELTYTFDTRRPPQSAANYYGLDKFVDGIPTTTRS